MGRDGPREGDGRHAGVSVDGSRVVLVQRYCGARRASIDMARIDSTRLGSTRLDSGREGEFGLERASEGSRGSEDLSAGRVVIETKNGRYSSSKDRDGCKLPPGSKPLNDTSVIIN
jgi:hypothetical protein